ncbi:unnamed protein product [Adineta steineri]|uniref:EGF-like domain-containing protein n=1 Tax=Adineta steineri TaxID=433720 RepID=A0A819DSA8_9BILA|nr:unnamed protein product [Adineta steineri]
MDTLYPAKVEYCIRPTDSSQTIINDFVNTRDRNYTFEELAAMNVSAYDILFWSASMDLAEQYQSYINQLNTSLLSDHIFFNCTQPWFGSHCQYSFSFDETQSILEFDSNLSRIKYTCYILLECNRGGPDLCLDWREICDGRIDCLNDGVDEASCFQLEINECNINEYRCHNGLCISEFFWKVDLWASECLDYSDTWNRVPCPSVNLASDLFFCEENTCPPGQTKFSCGDGECVEDFDQCQNERHLLLLKSLSIQGNLSYHCWLSMVCLTKIIPQVDDILCEEFVQSSDILIYFNSCERIIAFPIYPVLFGHVRFLYSFKNLSQINIKSALIPDYICYDERLCDFLVPAFRYESYTCRHYYQMGLKTNIEYHSWKAIIDSIKTYFHGCDTTYDNQNHPRHPSLYLCQNSSKYISKHRILDNIIDCYLKDDERDLVLSCSISDPHRFQCPNEVQCRSPIFSLDSCPSSEKKISTIDDIFFSQICDGTVDIFPQLINGQNHTDETNCEHWPCSNLYTRCDRLWHCPNGEDEEDCWQSNCSRHFLHCISPYNYTSICLPANQVRNGIIDCLGGLDELHWCQIANYYNGITYRFACLNGITCIEPWALSDCSFNDDETFCSARCDEWANDKYNEIQTILNHIGTLRRPSFTLETSHVYSSIENKMANHIAASTVKSLDETNDIQLELQDSTLLSPCTRGLFVSHWLANAEFSFLCVCPPNYYGPMCQYQNQRVSLTLTVLATTQEKIYGILIKLITEDNDREEINSYEQIIYISKSGCRQIFNMYLLYSTRPKDPSKNYSIHIDAYDKTSLQYLSSWYFKIPFQFLPVNRLALELTLRSNEIVSGNCCSFTCQQGTCMKYNNEDKCFCRCQPGWFGTRCDIFIYSNDCSADSIYVGNVRNRSICICPLERFGLRCLLKHSCPLNYCHHNGNSMGPDVKTTNQN